MKDNFGLTEDEFERFIELYSKIVRENPEEFGEIREMTEDEKEAVRQLEQDLGELTEDTERNTPFEDIAELMGWSEEFVEEMGRVAFSDNKSDTQDSEIDDEDNYDEDECKTDGSDERKFEEVVDGGYAEVNIPEERGKRLQKEAKEKANRIMNEVESEMEKDSDDGDSEVCESVTDRMELQKQLSELSDEEKRYLIEQLQRDLDEDSGWEKIADGLYGLELSEEERKESLEKARKYAEESEDTVYESLTPDLYEGIYTRGSLDEEEIIKAKEAMLSHNKTLIQKIRDKIRDKFSKSENKNDTKYENGDYILFKTPVESLAIGKIVKSWRNENVESDCYKVKDRKSPYGTWTGISNNNIISKIPFEDYPEYRPNIIGKLKLFFKKYKE